ncbi:hypothetical protein ACJMK2_028864 [Sinanodonta woodiana]|uniref:RING-type domain-containing protein n=1 Tax=Sinanodonta woodiana TaxID=1069815 RepID=A0ABD3XAN3_SINWO
MANANREVSSRYTREVQDEWAARQSLQDCVGGAAASLTLRSPIKSNIQEYMLTAAAQSVIETGYGPEMVQRAIERLLMKEGIENMTGESIMSVIFSIEEEEEGMPALHASRGEEISANEIDGLETDGCANANEPSGDQERTQERILREYQQLRDATLCKICFINKICVVFLPCGHLVTCSSCAIKVKECPLCRARVLATANAYFS